MEKLKNYLRNLSKTDRELLAKACETSFGHLRNVGYGCSKPNAKLCIAIERETRGHIKCEELRKDIDWQWVRSSHLSLSKHRP